MTLQSVLVLTLLLPINLLILLCCFFECSTFCTSFGDRYSIAGKHSKKYPGCFCCLCSGFYFIEQVMIFFHYKKILPMLYFELCQVWCAFAISVLHSSLVYLSLQNWWQYYSLYCIFYFY